MEILCKQRSLIHLFNKPFLITSITVLVISLFSYIGVIGDTSVSVAILRLLLFPLSSYCLCYSATNNYSKALACFGIVSASYCISTANNNSGFGVVVFVLIILLLLGLSKKLELLPFLVAGAFIAILIVAVSIYCKSYFIDITASLCNGLADSPYLFGALSIVYDTLFHSELSDIMLHQDYTGAIFADGKLVTGCIDIFSARPEVADYRFLSGKYIVTFFCSIGVGIAICKNVDKKLRITIIISLLLSVIFGDSILFPILILIFNPVLYAVYLVLALLSYFVSSLTDLSLGYINNGGVWELARYGNRWVLLLTIGAVILLLSYYSSKLTIALFDFDEYIKYPRDVKNIIRALGGEENIDSINHGVVIVNNPNLVNIIALDCEIHGDKIKLLDEDMDRLQVFM